MHGAGTCRPNNSVPVDVVHIAGLALCSDPVMIRELFAVISNKAIVVDLSGSQQE